MSKKLFVTKNLCILLLGLFVFGTSLPVGYTGNQGSQNTEDYGVMPMSDLPTEEIRLL